MHTVELNGFSILVSPYHVTRRFFGTPPPLEVQTGKRGTVKRKAPMLIIIQAKNKNFCVTRFFAIAIAIFEISIFCYILHSDMEKIVMQCVRNILNDYP